ncbi:nramp family manganese ion transporter [Schizosaccharomyces japonicus yFS275]|uniref:Nramp family manganese ion transporter n=1 Tax=Schizosaccharomyces japonicus (strain yFS275 / FY16936) TaxID=402676 RepID=B6JX82_SCHJY|nr:nramp family manganese ion transporter [Schizosaccharomyces japonicus yFS275]EEB05983.1 nramp family manganese ion transporter [Schizosaccharomyces japonicus yFS275]
MSFINKKDEDLSPESRSTAVVRRIDPVESSSSNSGRASSTASEEKSTRERILHYFHAAGSQLKEYCRFVGPGFLIAVAYIDPGNYSTDIDAGSKFQYKLLFVILLSNFLAVYLQSLCCRLGSVSGYDLARNCREHFPKYLCWTFYLLAEIAIIATDMAEVIGTAFALKILFKLPLPGGVVLTILDVLLTLVAWRPDGPMLGIRLFEMVVALLVLTVAICFALVLGRVNLGSAGHLFKGFLPSTTVFSRSGLYSGIGILGATVMPHSLYLGSGLVQSRLRDYDIRHNIVTAGDLNDPDTEYKPSFSAINHSLTFSIVEVASSLFTFALFTNSSILIVAGAVLYNTPEADASDLFTIYELFSKYVSKSVGKLFAVALLLSGISAGYVCTISGQMVSEGYINWTCKPWIRRTATRLIAIIPCLVVTLGLGESGLNRVLNASQVCLSILLPFLTFPLILFTSSRKVMTVQESEFVSNGGESELKQITHDYSLSWTTSVISWLVWLFLAAINILLIVWLALGISN